jgi:hypothetical protein
MKTKHIAIIALLSTLITSAPCSAEKNNPLSATIYYYIEPAQTWTSNFLKSCWNIGILATLYAKMGIYDFKKISGLDETTLDTYNKDQLENAQKRVETMIQYTPLSAHNTLNNFSTKIQGKIIQKEDDAQAAAEEARIMEELDMSYDKATAITEIKKLRKEKSQKK